MILTDKDFLSLFAILIGSLDHSAPIGGVPLQQRAQLAGVLIQRQETPMEEFDLAETNGHETVAPEKKKK